MKRFFGIFEGVFDAAYLAAALVMGVLLLTTAGGSGPRLLAGGMALVLVGGDAFHLLPRIWVIRTGDTEGLLPALGRGKQITSVTMTVFYLLLWQLMEGLFPPAAPGLTALFYALAAARVVLCLLPQNGWEQREPPLRWALWRNVPFFLMGLLCALRSFTYRQTVPGLALLWLAILLSFACYLPVVLWSHRNPKVGMLMLPKTCAYLWMLAMCLTL